MKKQKLWPLWVTQCVVQGSRGSGILSLPDSMADELLWDEHLFFFSFFFFNLVTDTVLLQCRHLTAVEAEGLYLSREQIVYKQQQRKVLQLDTEPHTCSAGTVPGCWLPVLLSLPLLPLAHGPVPRKVSRDYAVNTNPTIYFPSMKGNETTCFAYTVLWRAIR